MLSFKCRRIIKITPKFESISENSLIFANRKCLTGLIDVSYDIPGHLEEQMDITNEILDELERKPANNQPTIKRFFQKPKQATEYYEQQKEKLQAQINDKQKTRWKTAAPMYLKYRTIELAAEAFKLINSFSE